MTSRVLVHFGILLTLSFPTVIHADTASDNAFFENKIRPLLVAHCYECHSADSKKVEGNLRLDSRGGWQTGGDSGPAIIPGKPEDSHLIKAIRYDDSVSQMPPKGKLADADIATLTTWVTMGAPDPRDAAAPAAKEKKIDVEKGKKFWAFQPLHPPAIPDAPNTNWLRSPSDSFIEQTLAAHELSPNGEAEPGRLIRRVTLDLLGIPPEPSEVDHYTASPEPDRYERLVDRLMASPAFGERWGRHWLDVARFAESFGFEHDYDRPHAYHYRDFVIKAMNADMPYDQFVRWQLAGDEIAPEEPLAMMATGFLGAGVFPTQITANEVERTRYDALDDMLSTVGSGFLGLSIGCARCHDHKFDPIAAEDYYRMLSTFTTTVRSEVDLDLEPDVTRNAWQRFEAERKVLADKLDTYERQQLRGRIKEWLMSHPDSTPAGEGWITVDDVEIHSEGKATFTKQADGSFLASGENPKHDEYKIQARVTMSEITGLRVEALMDPSLTNGGPGRAGNGNFGLTSITVTASPASSPDQTHPVELRSPRATFEQKGLTAASVLKAEGGCWAIDPQFGKNHAIAFDFSEPVRSDNDILLNITLRFHCNDQHNFGRVRVGVTNTTNSPAAGAPAVSKNLAGAIDRLRQGSSIENLSEADQRALIDWFRFLDPEWQQLHRELTVLLTKAPQPKFTKVMIAGEGYKPIRWHTQGGDFLERTHQLKRGDTNLKGEEALPSFLPVLMRSSSGDTPWKQSPPSSARASYRRRSMSNWITDVDQGAGSLLARVIANRLWQHHLGEGIVSTPNDFGVQGDKPTHPQLLEWLAGELITNDWRMKDIHRLIVTSAAYRQSPHFDAKKFAIDPDNKFLWRFTPRRLEAESIRDSLFAVSGSLDTSMFGAGTLDEGMRRRSIYFTVKRSKLIPMMQLFDGPDTLTSLGRRSQTTTAPQALLFMNDPHLRQCAVALGERVVAKSGDPPMIVDEAYRLILSRHPTEQERDKGVHFLSQAEKLHEKSPAKKRLSLATADLAQVIFGLNEFIYIE